MLNKTLTAGLLLLAAGAAAVQLPMRMNFQGKLINPATSLPRNGTFDLTFSLYRQAAGGTAIYTESQTGIAVNNGVFSVQIGAVTPLNQDLFANASAYLGITVNNPGEATESEMTPRQYLAMSPYALTAGQLASASDIRINPGVAYSTFTAGGNLFIAAGVTAGTATITGSLTASSGTFTATGLNQYSLETSSGIRINAGTLDVDGAGGIDVAFGVRASTFTGDGRYLTRTTPNVSNSSGSATVTLVANTEQVAVSTAMALGTAQNTVMLLGMLQLNRVANAVGTCTLRIRHDTTGPGNCGITDAVVYAFTFTVANTASLSVPVTPFAQFSPNTTNNVEYCMTIVCNAAHSYSTRSLSAIASAP